MKVRTVRLLTWLATLSFSAALLTSGAAYAAESEAGREAESEAAPLQAGSEEQLARERLQQLEQAISGIEQWLQQSRRQRSQEETALAELDRQLAELQAGITLNMSEQEQLQRDIRQLDQEIAPLLQESVEQRAELAGALEASYLAGSESQLKLLLNQQDPGLAQRMMVYFAAFNQQRLQQIERWLSTISELRQRQTRIREATATLEASAVMLRAQEADLASRQAERQLLIARLDQEMSSRRNELGSLQSDRNDLQALIEEIHRVISDIPELEDLTPFAESRGRMPWPVQGELLARYGQTYSNAQLRRQGVIIAAPAGSPVRAVHPGRVVFSDWLRGSGNLVVVDHGNAYISLYAHNQQLLKRSGDWVNRGEPLALSGPDGGSGVPALYFEIRRNSDTLNPADWLLKQD